ncbi:MAG: hypothetical protein EA349_11975 [Halomonadaceae bacterium]|nr:MAG: hypothetical protein EA349_11975 [Halomonadaceae bacterium]
MPAKMKTALVTLMAVLLLTVGTSGHAHASTVKEEPSAMAMVGDALLVRPAMLAVTVVGSVVYTVSLPFSLAGGNAEQAGHTLVVGPAKTTFIRCLGCTMPGRQSTKVVGQDQD